MIKGVILRICMFIIIPSVLCLNPVFVASVEDCHNCGGPGTPTSAGNAIIQPGWDCICTGAKPTIVASSETIAKGGSITLRVNSGGLACPSYTWSTTSKGYTLNKTKTNNDEAVTLSCTTGTCGTNYDVYATITVTDNCGEKNNIVIRNTAGTWSLSSSGCGGPPRRYGPYSMIKGTKKVTGYLCGDVRTMTTASCSNPYGGDCAAYADGWVPGFWAAIQSAAGVSLTPCTGYWGACWFVNGGCTTGDKITYNLEYYLYSWTCP